MSDLERYLAFADTLADAARAAILPFFRAPHAMEDKGGLRFDPVTEADRAAEQAIRALIAREFPDHGVLGEEFGARAGASAYQWVIDPIDGTRAFIAGLPLWGVLIALTREGRPILGVLDQPHLGERYKGWSTRETRGATLSAHGETRPLKTRAALLSTTDPYLFEGEEAAAFARVRAAVKLTRFGYDCYAYGMVAMGGLDLVIESGLRPWDVAALIPILEGAGGGVCSWDGSDASQGGRVLAYGDARLRDAAMAALRA